MSAPEASRLGELEPSARARPGFWAGNVAYGLALFAAALALRAAVVSWFSVDPTWDGQFYHRGAVSIAEGHGYSEPASVAGQAVRLPASHYPVGYSALLAGAYALFGVSSAVAPFVNAVIGAATALLTYAFGLDVLGRRRGRIAGAIAALHPGLVLYCALVMTEPLAGLLVLSAGYLARRLGHSRFGPALAGAALGLGVLVRPQSLLTVPLLLLAFPGRLRQRFARTLVAGAVSLCVVAPWSVRNCLQLDGCAFVSTNGGWNLAIGALSDTGRWRALTPADGCQGIDGPVAQDRCWAERGWAAIRRDPWLWLSRIPDKLRHTYNHESFAVAYLAEAEPERWHRERTWLVMDLMTAFHHVLTFAAALGCVSRFERRDWRRHWAQLALIAALLGFALYALTLPDRPLFWIGVFLPVLWLLPLPGAPPPSRGAGYLLGSLAVTSLTHMVFFGDDRYHLVISPALCLLAAAMCRRSRLAPAAPSSARSAVPLTLPEAAQ